MKKNRVFLRRIAAWLVLLCLLVSLLSCDLGFAPTPAGPSYEIVNAAADRIVPCDVFSLSDLSIVARGENATAVSYPVTEDMISRADLDKLNVAGIHVITVRFRGEELTVSVRLRDPIADSSPLPSVSPDPAEEWVTFRTGQIADYYSAAEGKSGEALKAALREIISEVTHRETYDELRQDLAVTDAGDAAGTIRCFYSQKEVPAAWDSGATWNREHVWPRSKGWFDRNGAGADLHHIRPDDPQDNAARGNTPFGESADYFNPPDEVKGDVARIVFYLLVRYSEADAYPVTNVAESMVMLLCWNREDPVDSYEIRRNEATYEIQGNRNPFIDCEALADRIWEESVVSVR